MRFAARYLALSVDELIEDVLRHYGRVWREVEALLRSHPTEPTVPGLVLEGSAIWPAFVTGTELENTAAVWLTASEDLFRRRIHAASGFDGASDRERAMVRKFLARTLRYDAEMMALADRLGLDSIDVEETSSVDELRERCLQLANGGG